MKIAIIGSRNLSLPSLDRILPPDVTEIVSGGAKGIDRDAEAYAKTHGLKITIFYPEYDKFGRAAPLRRNVDIVDYADMVYAFWDGKSRGTKFVIDLCHAKQKALRIFLLKST